MKKILALMLAGCLALSMAACGGEKQPAAEESKTETTEPAATEEKKAEDKAGEDAKKVEAEVPAGGKVGVCIYKFDDAFMTTYRNALQAILEEKGYEVSVVDGNNDQAKQTEQVNTFITQGVDALIINPVMTSAADTIIAAVQQADVPTVLINREPTAEQMAAYNKLVYVGCDAAQSGTFQGEIIAETENHGDFNGNGVVDYVMIMGDPENVDAKYRTEFSIKALEDAGLKTNELYKQRGDWDQTKGQELAATALTQFGNDVDVIFCNNDAMALGAYQAIVDAGRTVGEDIYLVGVDALDEVQEMVKEGKVTGTVLNDHIGQSHTAADAAIKAANGETLEKYYWVDYVKVTK